MRHIVLHGSTARALCTASVRHVLVSLRPMADQDTSTFTRRFYHHWLAQQGHGDPGGAALRSAQEAFAVAA